MKGVIQWMAALMIGSSLLVVPITSSAQDKDQFRNQAKSMAAQVRAVGEPKDRCSLGVQLGVNGLVLRAYGISNLNPGDKFLSINHVGASAKNADQILEILRGILPSEVVPLTIERDGKPLDLQVSCTNARPYNEKILAALDFAAKGKFDDCVDSLNRNGPSGSYDAVLKAQCAATSKNASRYNISQLIFDALRMVIDDAYWVPAARKDVVTRLHQSEAVIVGSFGQSQFEKLADATKHWPGDSQMYDATTPDIGLFKRNAESALRARLIDPDSARIEWLYGFLYGSWKPLFAKRIEGYWTCGLINARNRMGGYTGSTSFVVVLDMNGTVKYAEMGEARDFDILTSQCNNSAKLLPPPPPELTKIPDASSQTPVSSIADELKKLVDLKNSGALTDAEFEAAKQRLLGTPNNP